MIESARITNLSGEFIDVDDDNYPFNNFTTEVDLRMPDRNRPQQHGQYAQYTYLGKRTFHYEGAILGDSAADYWAKRLKLLRVLTPSPHMGRKIIGTLEVQYTGIPELLTSEITLDGYPEIPVQAGYVEFSEMQLNFRAFDPKMYGQEQNATIAPPATPVGRTYNKTYNKTYPGGTGQPDALLIYNSGNIETYPRFRINGYVENPRLTLTRYDNVVLAVALEAYTVPVGGYVDLDFAARTAVANDGTNVFSYSTLTSRWWALEPTINGVANTVQFTGGNVTGNAQIYWNNAYMI